MSKLTGKTRYREHKRACRKALLVLQVERVYPADCHCDSLDVCGNCHRGITQYSKWTDATIEDLQELKESTDVTIANQQA